MRRRHHEPPISLFSFQDIITSVTGILILLAMALAIAVLRQAEQSSVVRTGPDLESLRRELQVVEAERASLEQAVSTIEKQMDQWSHLTLEQLRVELSSAQAAAELRRGELDAALKDLAEVQKSKARMMADPEVKQLAESIDGLKRKLADVTSRIEQLRSGQRIVYNFRNTPRVPWLVEIADGQIRAGRHNVSAPPQLFHSAARFLAFAASLPEEEQYFVLFVKPSGIGEHDRIREALLKMDADIGTDLIGEPQTVLDPATGAGTQ